MTMTMTSSSSAASSAPPPITMGAALAPPPAVGAAGAVETAERASAAAAPATAAPPTSAHALASAPALSVPLVGGQARTSDVAAAVNALNAVMDSFGSLLLAQQQLRQEGVARGTSAAEAGEQDAAIATERQREAMEATQRAQRRANRLLGGAPRWVKKLVAGIITAAGAVAGAFTGGVAAGLAIAGAVLILAGDAVTKILERAGIDPDKAAWVGFAVKLVGTALSMGAGFAGGATSAATSASAVRDGVMLATRILDTASTVSDVGMGTAASVFTFQTSEASTDSDAAGLEVDLAQDAQGDAIEVVRDAHQTYQRVLERMQSWLSTQQQTTQQLVSHLSA
jgi:hypothetical protein